MSLQGFVCVVEILCVCLFGLCRVAGDTFSVTVPALMAMIVVNTVVDRWPVIIRLLGEEVAARSLLAQSALEVLQLTQEVEVWGNGGPALFHEPLKERDRMWVSAAALQRLLVYTEEHCGQKVS